jgi:hypothetical protein
VELRCGTKYADVDIRLERWDGRPPEIEESWEDRDVLPWRNTSDSELVQAQGFDAPDSTEGLDVSGLGRARVEVLASGRHRYFYGDDNEGLPPERWLLRFWPDSQHLDALAGPPRRIAGPQGEADPGPWGAAVRAWSRVGWGDLLHTPSGFQYLVFAIGAVGRPFTHAELPDYLSGWWVANHPGDDGPWSGSIYDWNKVENRLANDGSPRVAKLATAAGLAKLETLNDAFDALCGLGLLAEVRYGGESYWTPNPSPRAAWDVLPEDDGKTPWMRIRSLRTFYGDFEGDLEHLCGWAEGGQMTVTPRRIATRLSISPDEVLSTIELLNLLKPGRVTFAGETIDAESTFTMRT